MTDQQCINTIRVLSAAQVQTANSGHPGTPLGCAPIGHLLFRYLMAYDSSDPDWWNRDRFVLSAGHGCALQYSLLHISGFPLSIEDLRSFRKFHSKCPGHPECFATPGVEVCSGPLGQGVSQSVGLAIAGRQMAAKYNKPNFPIFSHYVYALCGEGCLEEGVSSETASLAGHLGLGNLICIFDCNKITIDGDSSISFSENVQLRYEAYGWHVLTVSDGNTDLDGMKNAVEAGKKETHKPTLIIIHTTIGFGSSKEGTAKVHGAPLGKDDLENLREKFQLKNGDDWFKVEDEVYQQYKQSKDKNASIRASWNSLLKKYSEQYSAEFTELKSRFEPDALLQSVIASLPSFSVNDKPSATRASSGVVLNVVAAKLPQFIGGSADLTESNKTHIGAWSDLTHENHLGQYIRFGVREHGMAAICNGLYAYGGFLPFWATFLNFVTYAWGAVRLSCLSKFQILGIATHDSIEMGEDGPTHQPIEVLPMLRGTPNLNIIRPCDANEVSGGYGVWLSHQKTPTILALCRDAVPVLPTSSPSKVAEGAYVVKDFANNSLPKVVLGASGTEVHSCIQAANILADKIDARVISCPCWSLFMARSKEERKAVLAMEVPQIVTRLYVEASSTLGAERLGFDDVIEMTTFGASAPKNVLWEEFGFSPAAIAKRIEKCL